MESPMPRVMAMSLREAFFGSSGSRARFPASAGRSLAKPTSRSLSPATARMQTVTARLKLSASDPFFGLLRVLSPGPAINHSLRDSCERLDALSAARLAQHNVGCTLRQFLSEGALVELGDHRTLKLVALVEEGQPERHADIAEDFGVFGPGDHRTRAHHGRQVAIDEGRAR